MCLNKLYTLIMGQAGKSFPNFYLRFEFKQNNRGLNRGISLSNFARTIIRPGYLGLLFTFLNYPQIHITNKEKGAKRK
jgi:hypothetical protein